jgi:DNA recombination protein RmuC
MTNSSVLLIFLFVLLVIGMSVFFFFLWKRLSSSEPDQATQKLFEEFVRDREARYREQESLKNELREGSKALREEFHRVNRTVDTKLSESSKQLNDRLDKSSTIIGSLQKELGKMGEIGSKIEHLDKILRAPKARGSMGEEALEEILQSIFPQNLWDRQYTIDKAGIVDAVIHTSNGIIPIDSKFPLPAFERLIESEQEVDRAAAHRDFQRDVKKRIDEVAKYIRPEVGTLDFAILFLPNENIYYEAAIRIKSISEYAREKKVALTGPNTIIYLLQTIYKAYQSQQFAKKAQEALSQLSGLKKQSDRLGEGLSILGKHLNNAHVKIGEVQQDNQKLQFQIDRVSSMESEITLAEGSTETETESDRPALL